MSLLRSTLRAAPLSSRAFSTSPRASLAKMSLIGRLASAPELLTTPSGRELLRYAVGVNTGPKEAKETSWYQIASFSEGPQRDLILGLPKGTLVFVEAESRMRKVETGDGGGKPAYRLDLVQRTGSIDVLSRPQARDESSQYEATAGAEAEAGDEAMAARG
ncbi:hypothetical protein MRB53_038033 [Persea americana]|nr:hypothetical protein MRB53_038033 [Persea americana]